MVNRAFSLLLFTAAIAACGEVDAPTGPDAGDDVEPDAAWTLALTLEHEALTVPVGMDIEVDVTIARGDFSGDVVVDLAGAAPVGVTAAPLTIPAGASTGTFVFKVDDTAAAVAAAALELEAHDAGAAVMATASLALTIDPAAPAFDAFWDDESRARQRAFHLVPTWTTPSQLHVELRNGYQGAPVARWAALPAGVSIADVTIATGTGQLPVDQPIAIIATAATPTSTAVQVTISDGTRRDTIAADLTIGPGPALDVAFGSSGRVGFQPADVDGQFARGVRDSQMSVDSQGRPVVSMSAVRQGIDVVVLARFTATGQVDTTFGVGGIVVIALDASPLLALDANDRPLLVWGEGTQIRVMRRTAAGAADTTFGTGGAMTAVTGSQADSASAMRVRSGGDVYIAGTTQLAGVTYPMVMRVDTTGVLVSSYGTGGITRLSVEGRFEEMAFDSTNRLTAVGSVQDGAEVHGLVARFTTVGVLDTTFSTDGMVTIDPGVPYASLRGATVQGNEKILVTGVHDADHSALAGLTARLDTAGELDVSFGGDGLVSTQMDPSMEETVGLSRVSRLGTTVVVVGTRWEYSGSGGHILLGRFDDTGALDPAIGAGGLDWMLETHGYEELDDVVFTTTGPLLLSTPDDGTETSTRVLVLRKYAYPL